jgi:hypothetical protein
MLPRSGSPQAAEDVLSSSFRMFHPNPATSIVIKGETQLKMQ